MVSGLEELYCTGSHYISSYQALPLTMSIYPYKGGLKERRRRYERRPGYSQHHHHLHLR